MIKRRRILHADKIIQNVIYVFCLLMFLQLKCYCSYTSNPLLLYSTGNNIRVANISKPVKVNTIVKDLVQGSAVDFLYRKKLICWSDQAAELIECANFNGTHTEETMHIVSEGLIAPTGIAIDWFTEKIYWTDGETNKIEVISIENKYRKVLFWNEVDLARAIAVVPLHGLMFWTDWGEVPKIERAGMNGDPKTRKIIVKENINWPNGITVDYTNNLIYWVDAKLNFIDVIDFNGLNRKKIIVKNGLQYPYALTFFNDRLYWTDWQTWYIYTYDMHIAVVKDIIKSEPVPMDIKVFEQSRQIIPSEDYPCKLNNGGCSHLCLLSPEAPGYTCACPTGVKLRDGSNTTCYNGPQSLLIVAQRSTISKISLDTSDFTPYTLPLKDVKRAISVDFDPKAEYIYWSDNMSKSISRARLDGSEQMTIIHTGAGTPDSIAIDNLARNIYWTDPVLDTISVARLDGTSKKVVIYSELYEPRAIALHPTAGLMFWSDWNEKKPKIERANLDGTDRKLLISERLIWPNGIALDVVANKLYWGDARTHKIEVCNMDGSDRQELQNSDIVHIFGLTLLGDNLYWTDMQRRTLERINRITGVERQPLIEQMANMMGIKAFHIGDKMGWNPCVNNNGNCSHLCFNKPGEYVCSCPLGLELINDRRTCVEPEAFLIYSRKSIIGRVSIENENNDAVLPLKDIKEVSAIATHVFGLKIYWADSKTKTINRCSSINGSNIEKIHDSIGLVEGIAVDWSGQNIYWTDAAVHRIEVSRLDGSSRRALVWQALKKPKSIALDPRKGYMYWSELGTKTIKRAGMDGSSPTILIEQVGKVNSLAVDYEKRTIYWAGIDPVAIEYTHLDGSNRKKILGDIPMPYTLTLYMDRVYWGDWTTGDIESANKLDGTDRRNVHKKLDFISDLKVFHKSRHSGGNQCSVDNGGCSHLCLALPGGDTETEYKCSCPTHYKLNRDNLTCSEPDEFVLYAQKNSIGRIMIANGECNDATVPVTGLKNIKAIEYDPINKHLYWMDDDSHSIRRLPISYYTTSIVEASVVVKELSRPFHMVLDVLGRALYWSCLDVDSINVTLVDNNSSVWVVVRGEKMMPRHLALHQTKRLLIWNDVGLSAIMRANVDGTGITELAKANNATALTLDQNTGYAYWAVARQIHAIDIDGNNKRIVWQGGVTSTMCAYAGALYFGSGAGAGERSAMRVPLAKQNAPAQPVPHVAKLVASLTVHKAARTHPCYSGGACGGEAGACLAGGACACGVRCLQHAPAAAHAPRPPHSPHSPRDPPLACLPDHFLCDDRTHCVPDAWRCDGQEDCPDGSDESSASCVCAGGVQCADASCAHSLAACPAGALCLARPLPDAFRCDDRLCLAPRLLCDGHVHCTDGSDEAPAACGFQKDQNDVVVAGGGGAGGGGGGGGSRVLLWCGVAAALAGALALALAAARRCPPRGARARPPAPRALPLAKPPPRHHYPHAHYRTHHQPPHHRDTPLGESASDVSESLCPRYPRPTVNPPPSPATASGGAGAAAAAGRRRAYRHYRAMNRPPPPTPASTDAADSDTAPTLLPPSPPPPSPSPSPEPEPSPSPSLSLSLTFHR